jgi:predicted  nucleic acid-binding Zn-ribbon protein
VDLPGLTRTATATPANRTTRTAKEPALKADPFAQLKLLDVQELDARLDQLRHQLGSLPEAKQLTELLAERAEVDTQTRDARIRVDDLTRDQRRSDADVELVKTRRARDQDRMDKGLVTNPKDLERMQHELVSLERRIGELEDIELEIMEQLEEAQGELDRRTGRLAEIDERAAAQAAARDEKAGGLAAEAETVARDRKVAAEGMPADLMALYEKLRAQKGGVGAAVLRARQCTGCSLQLNAADLGVIAKAPADEVVRCEECDRILVRTAESGI